MTKQATIRFDVPMGGWPGDTSLVELAPALRRWDPETGDPVDYPFVAVSVKTPALFGDQAGVDVFPSDADGGFITDTMQPVKRMDYKVIHSALIELGYAVTN